MESLVLVLGAVTSIGVGFGLPLIVWAKQRKQTLEMIAAVEGRLQFHRSYYEKLQRETAPIFQTLDKRVTHSLYEICLLLSMVGEMLEQAHLAVDAPLADLSTVRTQLKILTTAGNAIGAPGETLDLSNLAGWDGRIELRLAFVKAKIERVRARRIQMMIMQAVELQQVAQTR